jgi:transcriptional regulator with XRE-family HTH domain
MRDKVREAASVRHRVGVNVRKLRKLKGWSQGQLAARVGNTQRHIGQIERGDVNVTIDYLTLIAANLSVDPADLFRASPSSGRVHMITDEVVDQAVQVLRVFERVKR